jgi:hypothetical protein
MLYREIIAVCSEIHTKHINTLCGQNVELLNVKRALLCLKGAKKRSSCEIKGKFHFTNSIGTQNVHTRAHTIYMHPQFIVLQHLSHLCPLL